MWGVDTIAADAVMENTSMPSLTGKRICLSSIVLVAVCPHLTVQEMRFVSNHGLELGGKRKKKEKKRKKKIYIFVSGKDAGSGEILGDNYVVM